MLKIFIPIEDDVVEGASSIMKMNASPEDKEAINAALTHLNESGQYEISLEDLGEDKDAFLLALAMTAIASHRK